MNGYRPDTPTQNGRIYKELSRSDISDNVSALDGSQLGTDPKPDVYEFLVRNRDSSASLSDGTGYDIMELLIRKVEKNLSRDGNRDQNLDSLFSGGIAAFGIELAVDPGAGPGTFAGDVTSGPVGIEVMWLTNPPEGESRGPFVYTFAVQGSSGPRHVRASAPSPQRGSNARFFVVAQSPSGEQTGKSDWEALIPSIGVDAGEGGGLLSGSGTLFSKAMTLLFDLLNLHYFAVTLTVSLRQVENTDYLFTEECFVQTDYEYHPWLMGKLGLTNPPVSGFGTTRDTEWQPPSSSPDQGDDGSPPDWEAEFSTEQRSKSDLQFENFVDVSDGTFVVKGERFRMLGGNHPALRMKSPQRIEAWLRQWKRVVPKLNTLRASALGFGVAESSDCLPLAPEMKIDSSGNWTLVHNDEAFERLDDLVYQCGKHGVRLVLMLNNYRPWQGGFAQFVEWLNRETGSDHSPSDDRDLVYKRSELKQLYRSHVDAVLDHENRYTGVKYKNDETIAMWELANEPRAAGAESEFKQWVKDMSDHVASKWSGDPKQLISTGGGDFETVPGYYADVHDHNNIDAWSTHVWADPPHWNSGVSGGVAAITDHRSQAKDKTMPMYVGELGWRVKRTESGPDSGQFQKRNEALKKYFQEINKQVSGYSVDGGLVWETRFHEEHSTLRELQSYGADSYDVYPSDDKTVKHMTL